jgi:integrase
VLWVTSHVYRRTVATLMDQNGCTAREAADQLGHAKVSMTQDVYFGRSRVVTQGAAVMEQIVSNASKTDLGPNYGGED